MQALFRGGKESLVHTDCTHVNISGNFCKTVQSLPSNMHIYDSVRRIYGHKPKPCGEEANCWFSKDYNVYMK